jgi:hypothetical protein
VVLRRLGPVRQPGSTILLDHPKRREIGLVDAKVVDETRMRANLELTYAALRFCAGFGRVDFVRAPDGPPPQTCYSLEVLLAGAYRTFVHISKSRWIGEPG